MSRILLFVFVMMIHCFNLGYAGTLPAVTEPIPVSDLVGYDHYSPAVKKLIALALQLSQQKITYSYGSSDPKNKGMDCSGTIYYLLNHATHLTDVPRQSNEMYTWAEKKGKLHSVTIQDFHSKEFSNLKPGDLLFWTGTYAVHREPPITHVMIYLGKNKKDDLLMFGASDGRYYQRKRMRGVSVFDLVPARASSTSKFVGYSCIPQTTC